jgi:DNA-binding YbaB/EbfC family protein
MAQNQMAKMMRQARKMQEQMAAAQEEISAAEFPASSGGGMVLAVVSGDMKVKSLTINPEAVDPDDVEMLQDMVIAAVNEAMEAAQKFSNERMGALTSGLNIPGMSNLGF